MTWIRAAARFVGITLILLLLVALLTAAAVYFFPEAVCQRALAFLLEREGFRGVEFTVAEAALDRLRVEAVQIGPDKVGLSMASAEVTFSVDGLRARRIDHVNIAGLHAIVLEGQRGWSVGGMPGGSGAGPGGWQVDQLTVSDSRVEVFAGERDLGGTLELDRFRMDISGLDMVDLSAEGRVHLSAADLEIPLSLTVTGELRRAASGERTFRVACTETGAGLEADVRGVFPVRAEGTNLAATVRSQDLSRAQGLLLKILPEDPGWSDLTLRGPAELEAALIGADLSGRCVLRGVEVALPDPPLTVRGVEADIAWSGFRPPSTPAGQVLTFVSAETAGLNLDDGRMVFHLLDRHNLLVQEVSGRIFGGTVRALPFRLDSAEPSLDLTLVAERLALDELSRMQSRVDCEAQGTVEGGLHVTWQPGSLPRMKGELASPPDEPGRIRFDDPSLVTRQMAEDDGRIQTVALSLRDFRYDRFRVAVDLTGEETATASLSLSGRSALEEEAPPINLNVNFEADIEDVVYLGRLYRKMGDLANK